MVNKLKDIIICSDYFSLRDQRGKSRARGQDGPILPDRVANQNTGFASSCCSRIQRCIRCAGDRLEMVVKVHCGTVLGDIFSTWRQIRPPKQSHNAL